MSLAVQTCDLDVVGVDGFAHLDYAATAPCVRAAADAVRDLLPYYGSVHRGTGLRSQTSTLEYERARDTVAEFVGARPGDAVVFTRNTTDALNLLARASRQGLDPDLLFSDYNGHLQPGTWVLAWLFDAIAPLQWWPAALLTIAMVTAIGLAGMAAAPRHGPAPALDRMPAALETQFALSAAPARPFRARQTLFHK